MRSGGKSRNHSESDQLGKAKYQALAFGIFSEARGTPLPANSGPVVVILGKNKVQPIAKAKSKL